MNFENGNDAALMESSTESADANAPQSKPSRLPEGLALLERASAELRAFLAGRGMAEFAIFNADALDLHDLDDLLPRLDSHARWHPMPLAGGEQPQALSPGANPSQWSARRPGVFCLPRRRVVVARWDWLDVRYGARQSLHLLAAPSRDQFVELRREMIRLRRLSTADVWQVVRGAAWGDRRPIPRTGTGAALVDLVMSDAISSRVHGEALRFFHDDVAAMYRAMGVPHRRGILMHGPPGNGKTSIIRALGAADELRDVSCFLMRAGKCFDDDDLRIVFRRWTEAAPAVLVIEDIDHLIKQIDVSQFLNLLDGIEMPREEDDDDDDEKIEVVAPGRRSGLLLIATTNHPEDLDPAINNRPGRFDVVIEVPNPTPELRRRFFERQLSEVEADVREDLVRRSGGMSFAHLQEVLRLSGILAINEGSGARSAAHLRKSVRMMKDAQDTAERGFAATKPDEFGLAQFRRPLR